jgi:hypothetical protein
VLLSTHAKLVASSGLQLFVHRKIGCKKKKVKSGPMHLQYTNNMQGVDIVDQLSGVYSS